MTNLWADPPSRRRAIAHATIEASLTRREQQAIQHMSLHPTQMSPTQHKGLALQRVPRRDLSYAETYRDCAMLPEVSVRIWSVSGPNGQDQSL
jgi:hypothetical protein